MKKPKLVMNRARKRLFYLSMWTDFFSWANTKEMLSACVAQGKKESVETARICRRSPFSLQKHEDFMCAA